MSQRPLVQWSSASQKTHVLAVSLVRECRPRKQKAQEFTMSADGKPYDIGYGKPPPEHQFRKGQIANPRGRAPGRKNLKTELLDELGQKIPVTEKGKRRLMSPQTVIIKRLVSDAAKGDARAREQLLRLLEPIDRVSPANPHASITQSEDHEIIERFRKRLLSEVRTAERDEQADV
jgi:Family of unknown function (DUF5681)